MQRFSDYAIHFALSSFLLLMLFFVYIPITHLEFAVPDDTWMLLKNMEVRPDAYSLEYFYKVFTAINDNQYSPLITLYYHLIYKINGYDPYYYHLFSFILHCLNTAIVGALGYRLMVAFNIPNRLLNTYVIALIWAVHPLNVEPTTWIAAVKIGWFCFFSLLSFLYFMKAYEKNRHFSFCVSTLFFLLSCFCKEQSIITPFVFLTFVLCHKMQTGNSVLKLETYVMYVCLMFVITFSFAVLTYSANNLSSTDYTPIAHYSVFKRIAISFYCLNFYLTSFMLPVGLHYHYAYPIQPNDAIPLLMIIYPLLLVICFLFIGYLMKSSAYKYYYLFCFLFFVFEICLVMQIIPMTRPAVMADRYMYLPLFSLLLIAIPFLSDWLSKFSTNYKVSAIAALLFLSYILFLIIYSQQLVLNWKHFNLIA